ncbi:MAG: hypothetical protein Q4G59_00690, partial [Planctomycetia bacterium]|nr:hypothetical protein [Planctomycetia bacterium]
MIATQGLQIDLDRLVRLVLDDLSGSASPNTQEEKPVATQPAIAEKVASCPITVKPQPESTDLRLTEKVITAAVVRAYESSPSKRWILPQGAFLTPSAKDELRGRNIELVRVTTTVDACLSQQTNT